MPQGASAEIRQKLFLGSRLHVNGATPGGVPRRPLLGRCTLLRVNENRMQNLRLCRGYLLTPDHFAQTWNRAFFQKRSVINNELRSFLRIRGRERSRGANYPILLVKARRFDLNWRVKRGAMRHLPDSAVRQLHLNLVVSYTDNCSFGSDTGRHLDFYFGSLSHGSGRASRDGRNLF
jgi:hypothetical protein